MGIMALLSINRGITARPVIDMVGGGGAICSKFVDVVSGVGGGILKSFSVRLKLGNIEDIELRKLG